ncbi:glycoside hydrolase family 13 protein [Pedobacter sp. ASV1-7]|uniref:glycoside hydrolase family 13 protein n=1 Tax=Pedobacter sp. ASV1-7 TaxID=3145237 RepID=UPI0032E88FB5
MRSLAVLLLLFFNAWANAQVLKKVEPMFWWVGMKNPKLQLMVYGQDIGAMDVEIVYPGVKIIKINQVENPNYLFLDLELSENVKPGKFPIKFIKDKKRKLEYIYELKRKSTDVNRISGVNQGDLIYELMPDRFANGDPGNDIVPGMKEAKIDRNGLISRHGGDLQGLIDRLDYLNDLGVTALWLTPEVENDQYEASYHGYAITDHYKIDPRFGTNKLYKEFVGLCHQRGIKVIKDVIPNHLGSEHWLVKDLPMKNWLNQWPVYTQTSFRDQTLMDPYAASDDRKKMLDGWFAHTMPDFNQRNEFVQNYITQNLIWWVEYAGIDGLRIDTYPYNDLGYMAKWAKQMKTEFPKLSMFGEALVNSVVSQAYFTQGDRLNLGVETNLPGVIDVQIKDAIYEVLNGEFGWTTGVNHLYSILSQDVIYKDATQNVVFLDNHDMSRFYSMIKEDINKYKSGLALLFTMRGIPQVYYGMEILMKNFSDPDGLVRFDFPGGWKGDPNNKFVSEGRTDMENEAFNYFRKLANFRKNCRALQFGNLMQYVPEMGMYVYFRYTDDQTVMVVTNSNADAVTLKMNRFFQRIGDFTRAENVITDSIFSIEKDLLIPGKTTQIYELKK